MDLVHPGNDEQCWWPGCTEPRIQPEDEHDRSWKVCIHHFEQLVRELHEALRWKKGGK